MSTVTVDKSGWTKLMERVRKIQDAAVKIGIQGADASEPHDADSGLTNYEIAMIHEFSHPSDTPPGRPFIRPVYNGDPDRWTALVKKACADALVGGDIRGALRQIGEQYRREVIERMKAGIPPPLAESTINRRRGQNTAAKRSKIGRSGKSLDATPLIDTGTLMGSISVALEGGK